MDLVLVQQENISGAPAGVRVRARLVIRDSTLCPPTSKPPGCSRAWVEWVPLTNTTEATASKWGTATGLLSELVLKFS